MFNDIQYLGSRSNPITTERERDGWRITEYPTEQRVFIYVFFCLWTAFVCLVILHMSIQLLFKLAPTSIATLQMNGEGENCF